jgi:hypothetical protein
MPMNPNVVELDPNDFRDCYWDLENDTIASAAWTSAAISPAGTPALTIGAPVNTTTRTTARVSGIALGALHELTCKVTCTSGQKIERSRYVKGVNL